MNDDQELLDRLQRFSTENQMKVKRSVSKEDCAPLDNLTKDVLSRKLEQWSSSDNRIFIPTSKTVFELVPGYYEIAISPTTGLYFEKLHIKTEDLLRFPQTNIDVVLNEIEKFWAKEKIFLEYKLIHRRGILLWGPPGGGKTCLVQLILKDVIERGGIAIKFLDPDLFLDGIRVFREIQPNTPLVVLMEDLDSIISHCDESKVLNILDGIELLNRTVFLGSTNYPEELGPRIVNRPSRFDKRFKIGYPNTESRIMYLQHLIGDQKIKELKIDVYKWAKDTKGFSLAHLKELFVATVILGDSYEESLRTLSSMKEKISSNQDVVGDIGFNKYSYNYEE